MARQLTHIGYQTCCFTLKLALHAYRISLYIVLTDGDQSEGTEMVMVFQIPYIYMTFNLEHCSKTLYPLNNCI